MRRPFIRHIVLLFVCVLLCTGYCVAQEISVERGERTAVRAVPDTVPERMKKEKEFLYANDPSYWKEEKTPEDPAAFKMIEAFARSPLLKGIMYLLIACAAIFVIYQVMVVNNFFIFSKYKRNKNATTSADEEDLATSDLDEKISQAIQSLDFRGATRYLFLKTLKLLSERNHINLHAKATNREYIRQMHQHYQVKDFEKLTGIYEYVWYGGFNPSQYQFESIHQHFNQFIAKV